VNGPLSRRIRKASRPLAVVIICQLGPALASEPLWILGRIGESRFCGGCHESRTASVALGPGFVGHKASTETGRKAIGQQVFWTAANLRAFLSKSASAPHYVEDGQTRDAIVEYLGPTK
jgi:hypothetical protein